MIVLSDTGTLRDWLRLHGRPMPKTFPYLDIDGDVWLDEFTYLKEFDVTAVELIVGRDNSFKQASEEHVQLYKLYTKLGKL